MTKEENKILGDLQERNAILQQCLEDVINAYDLTQAKEDANQCLGALSVIEYITPHTPMWIGVVITTNYGYYKLCLGVNQEDGNSVSFCNETDVQYSEDDKTNIPTFWNYEGVLEVNYKTDGKVFDDNNELIKQ